MGKVVFKLDADEAKAVNSFMKVVDAQKKTERQFGKSTQAGKRFSGAMGGLGKTMMGLAGGLIGAAGVRMAIGAVTQSLQVARREVLGFEDEITELLALGKNVKNIRAIKNEILDMSGATGIARKEIVDAMFFAQSALSNVSKEIKEGVIKRAIELKKVMGVDLRSGVNLLSKAFSIYGKTIEDLEPIQSKLAEIAKESVLTAQEMAVYMPDVLAAAKTFGYTIEEIGGALMVATGQLGKTEKSMTGLRNVFLRMSNAEKEGIELTGDFTEQIQELSKLDPEILKKIFGIEAIPVISALVNKTDELAESIKSLHHVQKEVLKIQYWERFKDISFQFAEMSKSAKEITKNIPLTKEYAEKYGKFDMSLMMRTLGAKTMLPQAFQWLAKPMVWMETMGGGGGILEKGRGVYIKGLRAGGEEGRARFREILWGETATPRPSFLESMIGPMGSIGYRIRAHRGTGRLYEEEAADYGKGVEEALKDLKETIKVDQKFLDELIKTNHQLIDAKKSEVTTSRSRGTE